MFIDLLFVSVPHGSVLNYDVLNVEIPTISTVGWLVKAGIPVLIYRLIREPVMH